MNVIKIDSKKYKFISDIKSIKDKNTFIKSLKQNDCLIILNKNNILEYAIKLSILEENR